MLTELQLKDLFTGKVDAKNEILSDTAEERARFLRSFILPENINIDSYLKGRKYIISGLKGTGKTALLQYLALKSEQKLKAKTSFILFKSDFTDDDKKDFSKAINRTITDKGDLPDEEDFVSIWVWFLHRHLVKTILEPLPFENNKEFSRYITCVKAPKVGDEEAGITRFFPKLKRGNVELTADFEVVKGKLGLDFDWSNESRKQVKFSSIVRQADALFEKLTPKDEKYYIFIDELELTIGKQKQYDKDTRLIRDLLVAINRLNSLCRKRNYPIYFITGIRSEVLTALPSSGKEINKIVSDFGVNLNWHQAGSSISNHPLLQIINKRIQTSEESAGVKITEDLNTLWEKYFTKSFDTKPIQEYILHQTWYRPRDIVRLLSIAQQTYPNQTVFSHEVFDRIRQEYSKQSWTEHVEELRAKYTEADIAGIKKLFYGVTCPFTFHDLTATADERKKIYSEIKQLLKTHTLGDIISQLYKVGMIGNTGQRVRFSFRGDDDVLLDKKMKIHDPLWNHLAIEPPRKK